MKTLKQNSRVTYRPASREDIISHYGCVPHSMRAIIFYVDGEFAAIAGYYLQSGKTVVFSEIQDDLDIPKTTVWRCTQIIMNLLSDKRNSYAFAENKQFLERLGFKPFCTVDDKEVYQWVN